MDPGVGPTGPKGVSDRTGQQRTLTGRVCERLVSGTCVDECTRVGESRSRESETKDPSPLSGTRTNLSQ